MTHWIWESTPVHVDFNSDAFRGEIIEPLSGEVWLFDLARYAGVAIPSDGRLRKIPVHPDTSKAEELDSGIRITTERDGVRCVFEILLDANAPELTASIRPVPISSQRIVGGVFPGPIVPKRRARHEVLDTVDQGRLHRPVSLGERCVKMNGSSAPMGWWAQLGEKSSLLAIIETPFDWEWSSTHTETETKALHRWISSQGALNYSRRLRYVFFQGRGYVQPARRYRKYAQENGSHVPLESRISEIPTLERLRGACSIFLGCIDDPECDYLQNLKTLKESGIERAFVYPVSICSHNPDLSLGEFSLIERPYLARDIEDNLEFVAAPEMWVETLREASHTFHRESLTRRPTFTDEFYEIAGQRFFHLHAGSAKEMVSDLEEDYEDFLGAHFEALSPRLLGEHRQLPWPYSRAEDARLRRALMQLMADRGMVVAANSLREWTLPVQNIGGGLALPKLGVEQPCWHVPLWQLVFHDACFSKWCDNDGYDNSESSIASIQHKYLLDILYGNMPHLQPMGSHFRFTTPPEIEIDRHLLSDSKTQEALPLAVRAARHHRRCAYEDMVYHAIVTEDGSVQESAFRSGLHVMANFGKEPFHSSSGHIIEGGGILID